MLQLLSLTLAYDDTRFFGSVMFTDPDRPDDKPATVLIDHADEPPWFRLTNVARIVRLRRWRRWSRRTASCGSSSLHTDRIGRTPADFPQL